MGESESQSSGPESVGDGGFRLLCAIREPDQRIVAKLHDVDPWRDHPNLPGDRSEQSMALHKRELVSLPGHGITGQTRCRWQRSRFHG